MNESKATCIGSVSVISSPKKSKAISSLWLAAQLCGLAVKHNGPVSTSDGEPKTSEVMM